MSQQAEAWTPTRRREARALQQSITGAADAVEREITEAAERDTRWHEYIQNASLMSKPPRPIWEQPNSITVVLTIFVRAIRRYRSARNAAWLDDLALALSDGRDPLALAHDFLSEERLPLVGIHFFVAFDAGMTTAAGSVGGAGVETDASAVSAAVVVLAPKRVEGE